VIEAYQDELANYNLYSHFEYTRASDSGLTETALALTLNEFASTNNAMGRVLKIVTVAVVS